MKSGPSVIDARTDPATFELNRDLDSRGAEVIASVQDFNSAIKNVKLSFVHVPLEIPMTHLQGNTWHAVLTDKQLQKLAVEGTTMKYEAYVMASDKDGKMSASPKSVTISVKAPQMSQNG